MGAERETTTNLSQHCLSLDLEVGVKDCRIHGFAAVRPDTGQPLLFPAGSSSLAAALAKLDDFADAADFVLGHNLIDFDLPHLQAAARRRHSETQSPSLPSQPVSPLG